MEFCCLQVSLLFLVTDVFQYFLVRQAFLSKLRQFEIQLTLIALIEISSLQPLQIQFILSYLVRCMSLVVSSYDLTEYTFKKSDCLIDDSMLLKNWLLGAFADLRRATIRFVMSVRLSVRTEQHGSNWTDFYDICYTRIFRKFVEKI